MKFLNHVSPASPVVTSVTVEKLILDSPLWYLICIGTVLKGLLLSSAVFPGASVLWTKSGISILYSWLKSIKGIPVNSGLLKLCGNESYHRITELFRLGMTFRIMNSNCWPSSTMLTIRPCPQVPCPHISRMRQAHI